MQWYTGVVLSGVVPLLLSSLVTSFDSNDEPIYECLTLYVEQRIPSPDTLRSYVMSFVMNLNRRQLKFL